MNVARTLNLARQHHQAGRLSEAERLYRQILAVEPAHADALHLLGVVALQCGHGGGAVELIGKAIALNPYQADFFDHLGAAMLALGRWDEAAANFREAIRLNPEYAEAHNNLGCALEPLGRTDEAAECYRRALALKPRYPDAQNNLGNILRKLGRLTEAVELYEAALKTDPRNAAAWNSLGSARREQGDLEEAQACFRRALEINPRYADAQNNLGFLLDSLGRFEEATACYRQAIAIDPAHAKAHKNLGRSRRYGDADRDEIARMEQLLAEDRLPQEARVDLHFALGKIYDDCGQWARAFEHYRQGNRLADVRFDEEGFLAYVDQLISAYTGPLLAEKSHLGLKSKLPIFIVGMPRSGTSLVEQILSAHPAVFGGGELNHVAQLSSSVAAALESVRPYPACIAEIDAERAGRLADRYLKVIHGLDGKALRVTDKMPTNFLHLGLIAVLLPKARIIHCRRHPLDTCLSCYFQDFVYRSGYAYDLRLLGVYYRQYARLMDHWLRVLPTPIFELDYEALTDRQEELTRRMIEYCGLDWDPRCLKFQENPRAVRTVSSWQVRQPIYTRSVGRWKNYEEFLGPLKEALGEILDQRS